MNPDFMQGSPELMQQIRAAVEMFLFLMAEISLLYLAISTLVGVINQKLPAEKVQALLGGKHGKGYALAAALGAITPFCSCSTIPMLIGLLKARAGFGPTMTFLITSPLLNPIVIALFIPVFGPKITLVYAALAIGVALLAGVMLQYFNFERFVRQSMLETKAQSCCAKPAPEETTSCCAKPKRTPINWRQAGRESMDSFRDMLPYMTIAMVLGALVHGFVPTDFFADVAGADNPLAIPAAAVIGIPLYIRVTALLPLVGSLVAKGVSLGAVMSLTIGAGGASIPELIMLKRLFHWPLLIAFVTVILTMAIGGGLVFNLMV